MWSVKFMKRYVNKTYDILLTGDMKIPADDTEKKEDKVVTYTSKLLNKIAYNDIVLAQEEMVCFQITEEAKNKSNKYEDTREELVKLLREFDATTGAYNTIL